MKHLFIYIFSLTLILLSVDTQAQDSLVVQQPIEAADEVVDQEDAVIERMPVLSAIGVTVDYGKLVSGLILSTEAKYEGGIQFEFYNKLYLVGEFGYAVLEPNGAYVNAAYISEGSYWRAGLGYKLDMGPKFNFYVSARYGQSEYHDKGEITIVSKSGIYDTFIEPFDRDHQKAHWYEVMISSERRMWKGLYAGFHLRFRVMGNYKEQVPLDVFSIPGYGRTYDDMVPAFNLYIKYSLEFFE
ncbi:MAG: DUF6048 family protein [Reichenbachiella sp.]